MKYARVRISWSLGSIGGFAATKAVTEVAFATVFFRARFAGFIELVDLRWSGFFSRFALPAGRPDVTASLFSF
jgi:hypothetical protein